MIHCRLNSIYRTFETTHCGMDLYEFLQKFHPIDRQPFEKLTSRLSPKNFLKGEQLVAPGSIQKEMYFIEEGIQMCHFDEELKTHVFAFTYPPNICVIPESFAQQKPALYAVTCLSNSRALCLSYDDLQKLFDEYREIERLFRKINETLLAQLLNRHLEFRTQPIEERYKLFCQRSAHLLHKIPHKYIASYLGIDATNFSKLYNTVKF